MFVSEKPVDFFRTLYFRPQTLQCLSGYAVVSRDFCKVYSYHDALPSHQLGRSHSPQMLMHSPVLTILVQYVCMYLYS